jgi:hypothetical protein
MNVTMTDRRAGKFEAKFFHKVNYTFWHSMWSYFLYAYYNAAVTMALLFRFYKKKLVVLKGILDQSMHWHLILMVGGNYLF